MFLNEDRWNADSLSSTCSHSAMRYDVQMEFFLDVSFITCLYLCCEEDLYLMVTLRAYQSHCLFGVCISFVRIINYRFCIL